MIARKWFLIQVVQSISNPTDSDSSIDGQLVRRMTLVRQSSAPLPVGSGSNSLLKGISLLRRQASRIIIIGHGALSSNASIEAMGALINAGQSPSMRAVKEEQMFRELGYLVAPNPLDELERRRALYKFNIWNTGSDLNFDRIAHLAKLVFNTKGVFISLLDGNEQWFKSEWGLKMNSYSRVQSFCAHAILQRNDEPMVILDTLQDWRFANNPNVLNAPCIRFYAGAPLRTQDGHNVGSLAVIDDAPREEFTPRHRHTLKEFAAIAMREMELWRDKIQLRIRDRIQNSMEQFSRECLEIDMEQQDPQSPQGSPASAYEEQSSNPSLSMSGSSMERVYDRAAKLVQRTLDVEGVIVMDVSHCEVLENMSGESTVNVVMHHGDPDVTETTTKSLTADEYAKLNVFFAKNPDGKISEGIVPQSFRLFLPTTRIQYALTVPIYNIDKRPFALLCAYNASEHTKRFLEGHELSYLRAIGVIILSAVLKRRMLLADKAKSLFISNISHELRTPLHGILAAAELLGELDLNHTQLSFLQTVQACGTSLVETVNHVLDFTKLSGNSKAGGVENVIIPTKVDLMQLVEDAVDGCWIGHCARTAIMEDTGTGIGSVYSPPKEDEGQTRKHVEAVIDIGPRLEGWVLKCEKGGIRRVLMNIFGNSLKFTSNGFVHVILRELPPAEDDPPNKIKVELAVHDTGKGISQNFLKNQLFHPFSQENPLQTGTGLGLAIVNSIVTSDSVGGKVDVWSEENVGTEIKITFPVEVVEADEVVEMGHLRLDDVNPSPTVSLVGFEDPHKGIRLMRSVLKTYITKWWGLEILENHDGELGNIVILNEDVSVVVKATQRHDTSRPFVVLSALRGNPTMMSAASDHELIGGFCRIIYKPGGPSRIRSVLRLCLHAMKIGSKSSHASLFEERQVSNQSFVHNGALSAANTIVPRRYSEDSHLLTPRPSMSPRSTTAHPNGSSSWKMPTSTVVEEKTDLSDPDTNEPTITLDSGGTLLKSSIRSIDTQLQKIRVLLIEDNSVLRGLLVKWLSKKGFYYRDAVDGRDGVNAYEKDGPFDVVLLDLSMPVLDGIGATAEIRRIESGFTAEFSHRRSRILALTGMSSLEDKRRAFDAGVDGYLVKPHHFAFAQYLYYQTPHTHIAYSNLVLLSL
ncbi:histidine kinase [Lentinula edodes]|uniref:histidine kinase n=1 Tax=Lentinula edodes TaxID=5353 RepID=A0A1Q3E492_LENED|nr:histidine kinase [Lentinula edodes]